MGGGKRKFPTRGKYKPVAKEEESKTEDSKEPPKKEDVDNLLNLWQSSKKKEPENSS